MMRLSIPNAGVIGGFSLMLMIRSLNPVRARMAKEELMCVPVLMPPRNMSGEFALMYMLIVTFVMAFSVARRLR